MKKATRLPIFTPWFVLVLGFIITFASWKNSQEGEIEQAEVRFNTEIVEHVLAIKNRMQDYEQILRAGVALFDASNKVDRNEWKSFAKSIQVQKKYPGTLGYAYATVVPHDEIKIHEAKMQTEGFPNYRVRPIGKGSMLTAIIFLEPLNSRNIAAIGYNMFKEPNRLAAMKRALETGEAALAGRVKLVQENKGPVQAGTLMYLPVYQKGVELKTAEDRRAAIMGFVYAPLRMGDLMNGILGDQKHLVGLHIFDGESHAEKNLMYNSDETFISQEKAEFKKTEVVEIAGRKWTLDFASSADFNATIDASKPLLIAIGGTLVNILLFGFVNGLARSRGKAVEMAKEMTVEIRKLSIAVEQSPSVVIITDPEGNIVYVNPRFVDVTGYTAEEVLGQNPRMLKSGHVPEESYSDIWQALLSGKIWRGEIQNRKKDGSFYWASVAMAPIRNEMKETTGFVSLQEDITTRKDAEVALIASKDAAEAANRAKSEFMSTMSHELRTPLTAAMGNVDYLLDPKSELDEETLEVLGESKDSLDHLLALLTEILDFSKIEAGKLILNSTSLPVAEVINKVLDSLRTKAGEKELELKSEVHAETVFADPIRLKQIFLNLIGNAIKFTESGSITVTAKKQGDNIEIRVIDTGIGIAQEHLQAVFEKFKQVDGSATRSAGGTGLGLAITQKLVFLHGGTIHVESELGKGSSFIFTIPETQSINKKEV